LTTYLLDLINEIRKAGGVQQDTGVPSLGSLGPSARAVVRELLVSGPLPRAELARRLHLSPASLTKTTRPLLDSGTIQQVDAPHADSRGRPGTPLALNADRHQFVGLKVTSDELFAVRADALGRVRQTGHRTITSKDVEVVVDLIIDLVNELRAHHPVHAVGVGLAGLMHRFDDTVRNNGYLGWNDVPLASMLHSKTGVPAVVSGDVRALTAGVQWSGPGRGLPHFAVVTVGVGIGLGTVLDGQVFAGAAGNAGLVGHLRISDSGPLCPLGHRGCAASFLTTAAITHGIGVPLGLPDLTLTDACSLAAEGNDLARRVFDDAGHALGILIAEVVNLFGVPMVVLAGDGLAMLEHAAPAMNRALTEHLNRWATPPKVEVFSSDFDEWARGAAVVACQWLLVAPPRDSPIDAG
jgi:predicted NBD/HSP70 family sugar kinase